MYCTPDALDEMTSTKNRALELKKELDNTGNQLRLAKDELEQLKKKLAALIRESPSLPGLELEFTRANGLSWTLPQFYTH